MIFDVGQTRIQKIHEMDLASMTLKQLLPSLNPQVAAAHSEVLPPAIPGEEGKAFLSIHSWLVRHEGHLILIDTGAGNDKARPQQKVLDHLSSPYLAELKAAGVQPGDVDMVLLTHIHSDHVGWNTRLENSRWVATFPNAVTVCSAREWHYGIALTDIDKAAVTSIRAEAGLGQCVRNPVEGTFADSMRPLESTGQVRLIEIDGTEVIPGIRFLPTPGHSIDHASIELVSDGHTAIFGGDVLHQPIEIYDCDAVSCFCEFPEAVPASRLKLLHHIANRSAVYFSSHFPQSSVGHILEQQGSFEWRPISQTEPR